MSIIIFSCLGVLLAVFILYFLAEILGVGLFLIGSILVLATLATGLFLIRNHPEFLILIAFSFLIFGIEFFHDKWPNTANAAGKIFRVLGWASASLLILLAGWGYYWSSTSADGSIKSDKWLMLVVVYFGLTLCIIWFFYRAWLVVFPSITVGGECSNEDEIKSKLRERFGYVLSLKITEPRASKRSYGGDPQQLISAVKLSQVSDALNVLDFKLIDAVESGLLEGVIDQNGEWWIAPKSSN